MLNVLTGPSEPDASVINPTMELESMPPDRKAPSGTSDIIWLSTARPSVSRSESAASSSLHVRSSTSAASQ